MTVATEDGQMLALQVCRASFVCFHVWPPGRFLAHQVSTCIPRLAGTWASCWNLIEMCEPKSWPGFPGSSAGKESSYNAGDPGSIPRSRGFPGEGIGYPLQDSWASLMAQTIKNLPVMQETWVQSLGWEDPLEEGMATHSSILAWRIPMNRGAWQATVHRVPKSRT